MNIIGCNSKCRPNNNRLKKAVMYRDFEIEGFVRASQDIMFAC
jgi:hypothetical protein